ncbi:hypothetical protein ACFLIM_41160 [Nonomuraea sp. M3C6]|uniref:Phosphotransferase enzyme family protein n=1 Tax=Nonomuraea marmarensis TaxID=3351344 RepID=A0ABW7AQC1_9ACTN
MTTSLARTVTSDRPELGWHHHADGTFRKTMPRPRADTEHRGWQQLRGLLPIPDLLSRRDLGDRSTLIYQDVFARGRCRGLLADVITEADADPSQTPRVRALVDAVCDNWQLAYQRTGQKVPLSACVPALYAGRLRPRGRLDRWYGSTRPLTVATPGRGYSLDLPDLLGRLRTILTPASLWPSAITQGDPTEPNIACDELCWLDFEHAGRNSIAGEAAVMFWYLAGMGGWLVPAYQPATYARTVHRRAATTRPALRHLHIDGDHIEVDAALTAGPGRRAALQTLLVRLDTDLADRLAPPALDPRTALGPWLALRILGVIPLSSLSRADAAICLALLGRALDPAVSLSDLITDASGTPHAAHNAVR